MTLCTFGWKALFGEINEKTMIINDFGLIVCEEWLHSAQIRQEIELDEFIVMPDHVHGILRIVDREGDGEGDIEGDRRSPVQRGRGRGREREYGRERARGPGARSLGAFVAGFKSAVTRRVNLLRGTPGSPVWHRSYYERIIWDQDYLEKVRRYIINNPSNWEKGRDECAPEGTPHGPRGIRPELIHPPM